MSAASRITLGMAVTVSTAIIGYVHYKQSADRLKLHDGVLRDVEQQQRRKHENTYTLQQQIDITKQLKAQEASSSPENSLAEEPPCRCKCCTGGAGGATALASCSKHPEQPGVGESGDEAEAAANEAASRPPRDED